MYESYAGRENFKVLQNRPYSSCDKGVGAPCWCHGNGIPALRNMAIKLVTQHREYSHNISPAGCDYSARH